MGIRFYCPNGHRLNVKSYLAGRRGICPHCSARFRIPEASQIADGAPRIRPAEELTPLAPGPSAASAPTVPAFSPAVAASDPVPDTRVPTTEPGVDPIAEAPNAIWYVRPPSGGDYGPASGEVVRRWIAERRVSAETLLWREGWAQWLPAGALFPSLPSPSSESTSSTETTDRLNREQEPKPQPVRPSSSGRRQPDKQRTKSVAIVVTLGLMIVVLSIALVYVLRGMR